MWSSTYVYICARVRLVVAVVRFSVHPYIGADSKVVYTSVRRCAPSESAARVLGAPTPQPHPDPFPHRGSREAVR
jgi:hypothetical protein